MAYPVLALICKMIVSITCNYSEFVDYTVIINFIYNYKYMYVHIQIYIYLYEHKEIWFHALNFIPLIHKTRSTHCLEYDKLDILLLLFGGVRKSGDWKVCGTKAVKLNVWMNIKETWEESNKSSVAFVLWHCKIVTF